jgi:hypothetical protein
MILEAVMSLVKVILTTALGFINIPLFPSALTTAIDTFFDLIFDNLGIVGFFVRWQTVLVCVPLVVAISNMDKIYDFVIWILRKIPMLGMS